MRSVKAITWNYMPGRYTETYFRNEFSVILSISLRSRAMYGGHKPTAAKLTIQQTSNSCQQLSFAKYLPDRNIFETAYKLYSFMRRGMEHISVRGTVCSIKYWSDIRASRKWTYKS